MPLPSIHPFFLSWLPSSKSIPTLAYSRCARVCARDGNHRNVARSFRQQRKREAECDWKMQGNLRKQTNLLLSFFYRLLLARFSSVTKEILAVFAFNYFEIGSANLAK